MKGDVIVERTETTGGSPDKLRVLIADDSRIVRATLIRRIQGVFDFREAVDGQSAWEILLLDPMIRVVITDLTMPRLDGYGLLERIRSSKISRIRTLPVIVISGSDEQAERERAKAAGATELITKGIATAQLLSHLTVLSDLVTPQMESGRTLNQLIRLPATKGMFLTQGTFLSKAETLLASAAHRKTPVFVLKLYFTVWQEEGALDIALPRSLSDAIGMVIKHSIRANDCISRTAENAFVIAISGSDGTSARSFGSRVCAAVQNANLIDGKGRRLHGSCGLVHSDELLNPVANHAPAEIIAALMEIAHCRAIAGLHRTGCGVIGAEEEDALNNASVGTLQ